MSENTILKMRRRLVSMDVVLHEKELWIVSSCHMEDSQNRQVINLTGYKRTAYANCVHAFLCKIVYDAAERQQEEVKTVPMASGHLDDESDDESDVEEVEGTW